MLPYLLVAWFPILNAAGSDPDLNAWYDGSGNENADKWVSFIYLDATNVGQA